MKALENLKLGEIESIDVTPHYTPNVEQMVVEFKNGYGVSVLGKKGDLDQYTGVYVGDGLYEVGILHEGTLTDVLGQTVYAYQTENEVRILIKRVSNLSDTRLAKQ